MAQQDKICKVLSRFDIAKNERERMRSMLDEAYRLSMPNRYKEDMKQEVGRITNAEVYDSTLQHALRVFTSKLQFSLTPPDLNFALLDAGPNIPDDFKPQINKGLQDINKVLFEFIRHSRFDLAVHESYADAAISIGVILINEGDDENPFDVQSVDIRNIYAQESSRGILENVFRDIEDIPIRNIKSLWPNGTLSSQLEQLLKSDNNATASLREASIFDEKTKQFNTMVIHPGSQHIIFEEVSDSSPWIVYRMNKFPGDNYGRGPVIDALPSAQTLNKIMEFDLRAAHLKVAPPFMAFMDDLFNPFTIRIEPNAIIPINSSSSTNPPIQQLRSEGDLNYTQLRAFDLREQVNKLMFAEPIGPVNAPAKTATEITIRQQNLVEEFAPASGRLQTELLDRVFDRFLFILRKKGLIPNIDVDGDNIRIKYLSPLMMGQSIAEVRSFQEFYHSLISVVGPEQAVLGIKPQMLPQWFAQKFNVDIDIINTPAELAIMQKQFKQQQAQQQEQQLEGGIPNAA